MKIDYSKNPKILNDFLDYLLKIRNYAESTSKAYCLDLLCFFRFIKVYMNISAEVKEFNVFILLDVNKSDIIAFLVFLNDTKNNSGSTRKRKLSAIRKFYKWLINNFPSSSLKINPTDDLLSFKKVQKLPKHLSLEQAKSVCNIFTIKNTKYPIRNNMIISLFLQTGLRLSELSNLNIRDINFKEKYIHVIGKGNKERSILMNEYIKTQLLKYIKIQNKNGKIISIDSPLFVNHQKQRLNIWGIGEICKKAFKLAELEQYGYSTHSLRHTFATIMYEQTDGDILLIKKLLGHIDIVTTQIYTFVYPERVKRAINSNPLNDDFNNVA